MRRPDTVEIGKSFVRLQLIDTHLCNWIDVLKAITVNVGTTGLPTTPWDTLGF